MYSERNRSAGAAAFATTGRVGNNAATIASNKVTVSIFRLIGTARIMS